MKRACCIFWLLLITFFSAASSYDVFRENGKVGLKNEQGKILIPAKYDALGWSDGKFSVVNNVTGYKDGGVWGLINLENQLITKAIYEDVAASDGSLIIARKKSTLSLRTVTGCLSTSGKEVIPFQYDGINISFMHAIVFTKIGNQYKYGLIDLDNKTLIPQQFKSIYSIGSLRYAVENFDNKMALFTETGKQVTSFSIDSISPFKKNYAIIYQNARQGLIDRDGQIKAEPTFREIRIDDDGSAHKRGLDEWLFLDGQNLLLQRTEADSVKAIDRKILKVTTAGLTRVEDYSLKPLFPLSFSTLGTFINNKAIFSLNKKYGVVRQRGTMVVDAKYDQLYRDHDFFVGNRKSAGKEIWTLLDSAGKELSTKPYDRIFPYNGSVFPVMNRNFWGAINATGKEVIACAYDSILQQLDDKIVVKFKGQYGIINDKEQWVITPRNFKLTLINDSRYLERSPKMTYLRSMDGSSIYFSDNRLEIIPEYIIEHLAAGGLWKLDLNGVIVDRQVQPEGFIEKIFVETEGLRGIKKNGQYGFVDSQGRLRIANRYDDIQPFQEELAAAKIRNKWGFINHEDKIAIQPAYEEVSPFKKGFSLVKLKGLYGLINKKGTQIIPPRYEFISILEHGNVLVQQEKLFGLANAEGRILINPKYHGLEDLNNNYVIVERDGKYGVVTAQGISTIPLIYDHISYDAFNNSFIALKKSEWSELKL
ncbi:MAG TPA: WG repeat-containing protein [Chryseolinea sp.]|nr:WG repeat-containing protein [Chryseolinea sp.]